MRNSIYNIFSYSDFASPFGPEKPINSAVWYMSYQGKMGDCAGGSHYCPKHTPIRRTCNQTWCEGRLPQTRAGRQTKVSRAPYQTVVPSDQRGVTHAESLNPADAPSDRPARRAARSAVMRYLLGLGVERFWDDLPRLGE